ncbi:MAG: homocysteine S-methyltransferase family protein [Planctomycetota bacterium]|nr:homocysteine S-methyltransferase family protein [Planctomycetota bacterium]
MSATLDSLFPDSRVVLLDGAMGSSLHELGWPTDQPTDLANLVRPELVEAIHAAHHGAGAQVITTNTFGALIATHDNCLEAVREGSRIARRVAGFGTRVAGSVAAFDLAANDIQAGEVVKALVEEGVDLLVFETCNKLEDAAEAIALRQRFAPALPAVISASTTDGSRPDWTRVRDIIAYVRGAGDSQIEAGLNCCRGPYNALRIALSSAPVIRWLKPSTGPPSDRVGDEVMSAFARAATRHSVRYVGGCCGANQETLTAMSTALHFAY